MLVLGIVVLLLSIFLPGYFTVRLLRSATDGWKELTPGEVAFASLATGFFFISWLSITLVELRHFTPLLTASLVAGYTILAALLGRAFPPPSPLRRGWHTLLPLIAILAVLPLYRPFEYVLGGRDPGVYVSAGIMISREGGVPFRDRLVEELPAEDRGMFLYGYSSHGILTFERLQGFWYPAHAPDRIVPQGMHLLPAWFAIGRWILGYPGLLWITPLLSLFGAAGVYYLCSRISGHPAAVLCTALLLTSPVGVYFARYPTSEILVQALIWSSLFFFHDFASTSSRASAVLAGVGTGLTTLARLDSVLFIVPVSLLVASYLLAVPRPKRIFLFAGAFTALLGQAALHLVLISRPYVLSVINILKIDPALTQLTLPGFVILLMTAYLLRARLRVWYSRLAASRWASLLLTFLVGAGAGYAWLYRPLHPGGEWDMGNANSFKFYAYYLGTSGAVCLIASLMYFIYGQKRRNLFFTFTIVTCFGFYFYRLQIYPELIWAMRRFLPVVWPATFVLIAIAMCALWKGGRHLRVVAIAATALLLWHAARTSPMYFRLKEYDGAVAWARRMASIVGDRDLLIFEPRFANTLQALSLPLWSAHERNVLQFVFENQPGEQLEKLLDQWKRVHGGRVLLALQRGVEIDSLKCRPRLVCSEVASFPQLEQVWNGYPRKIVTLDVPIRIYELQAMPPDRGGDLVDLGGGGDDLLVSSFYGAETGDGVTYRWSSYKGGIFLPAFDDTVKRIEVRMTQGPRPEALGRASCTVSLSGVLLGATWPTSGFSSFFFDVPESVRALARAGHPVSLFLRATPFHPFTIIPGSTDSRTLGVAVDYVRLIKAPDSPQPGN